MLLPFYNVARVMRFLAFSVFLLLLLNVTAQNNTKSKIKTPDELLCISYQDIYGQSINTSDETQFKRYIEASKDKDLCRNNYINYMLYPESNGQSVNLQLDSAMYNAFKSTPHLSRCRDADPFLVLAGFAAYFGAETDPNFFESMSRFMQWQGKYVPHSPLYKIPGNDESDNAESNLPVETKAKMHVAKSKEWAINYRMEYEIVLKKFDSCYKVWYGQNGGTNIDFIIYESNKVGHTMDKECKLLINASPTGSLNGLKPVSIPTDLEMRKDVPEFIREVYETLYMRTPTKSESDFLERYINDNKSLTVKEFFYAMMTSEEYKYY